MDLEMTDLIEMLQTLDLTQAMKASINDMDIVAAELVK